MKVGDLVTFSSTGASLKVVKNAYQSLFYHWDQEYPGDIHINAHKNEVYKKVQNYLFLGIVVSTKGLTKQQMENIEKGMRYSVGRDMREVDKCSIQASEGYVARRYSSWSCKRLCSRLLSLETFRFEGF
jgi:hypothetical protein